MHRILTTTIVFPALLLVGCGDGVETAPVAGIVTRSGEPLDQVMVYFMPDPEQGGQGAYSSAITDDQGRYELTYNGDPRGPGAAVGSHRVTLEDMKPENHRGPGPPPESRVPQAMTETWQTPLKYEVEPGEQEINIDVPPPG